MVFCAVNRFLQGQGELLQICKRCSMRLKLRWTHTSSGGASSSKPLDVGLPPELLPSPKFIGELKTDGGMNKLARLITELELLSTVSERIPRKLTDNQWYLYYRLKNTEEREQFLRLAYYDDLNREKLEELEAEAKPKRELMSEVQQKRHDNGEMVYSRLFHTIIDARGQEFLRKAIDRMYGCRLLAAERAEESLPKLILDCRFLSHYAYRQQARSVKEIQELHEKNWSHRQPFWVSMVNCVVDDYLATSFKKHLYFLTGPPRIKEDIEDDDLNCVYEQIKDKDGDEPVAAYQPHPFVPSISRQSIRENLGGIKDDEIAYFCWNAPKYIEGPLNQFKAFVLCPGQDEVLWHSSLAAARSDNLNAYQLPIRRHIKWEASGKSLSLRVTASILRDVYTNGGNWKAAILEHVPGYFESLQQRKKLPALKNRHYFETVKDIGAAISSAQLRQIDLNLASDKSTLHEPLQANAKSDRKRVFTHRYSREERNLRRLQQRSMIPGESC